MRFFNHRSKINAPDSGLDDSNRARKDHRRVRTDGWILTRPDRRVNPPIITFPTENGLSERGEPRREAHRMYSATHRTDIRAMGMRKWNHCSGGRGLAPRGDGFRNFSWERLVIGLQGPSPLKRKRVFRARITGPLHTQDFSRISKR